MTLQISEIFLSIQGEGPSAGTPASFVRLQGCDVGCGWCDTKYSWDETKGRACRVDEVLAEVATLGKAPLLVVTGGEPLQQAGITRLLEAAVLGWPRVEVETSGIVAPSFAHARVHYNVSPKLPSATTRWRETWRHVERWKQDGNATFKIVVGDAPDPEDARRLIAEHGLPRERVMLMPEGMTDEALRVRAGGLAELCKREGLRMSPRLHVWMWGARRGV